MTGDYGKRDRSNRDQTQSSSRVPPGSPRRPVPNRPAPVPNAQPPANPILGRQPGSDASGFGAQGKPVAPALLGSLPDAVPDLTPKPSRRGLRRFRLPRSWLFWGITSMVVFSGLGIYSAALLLKIPALPNCPAIFWPTASASLRLYCAQIAADKRTVKDLLQAISMVDGLPKDHPLRAEIDHNIEAWAKEILDLGEESFQAGDLDKAIDAAKQIPANTAAHALVEARIAHWQKVWQKADAIYHKAEEELKDQNLRQAFRTATQLLGIGNQYWENTKYRELNDLIVQTREDTNKIDKAKGLTDSGGLANLLAAVKLVQEIKPTSYVYSKAQDMLADLGQNMLDLAEAALDRRDYDKALEIAQQIPDAAKLQEEVRDFKIIAEAQSQAWGGTIDDLQAAIVNVQRIRNDRPLYGKAQLLVSRWQLEIQDVTVLNRARQLAQPGANGDLSAAIAEAQRVPFGNPRRDEAEKLISGWRGQIETSEDQPYLDRAEQLASSGDLQAAINQVSKIQPGRTLYDKASRRIDDWTAQIQRSQDQPYLDRAQQLANSGDLEAAIASARQISSGRALSSDAEADIRTWTNQLQKTQDQPYLDQARQLASQGNLGEAIATAERIGSDRALYSDAQTEIRQWRTQYQGQDQMRQAYNAANLGTPQMLAAAIEIAGQVPSDNPTHAEASRMIDQWSYQLLQMAEAQAGSNPSEAIAIAERIPSNTGAYAAAQRNIQAWKLKQR